MCQKIEIQPWFSLLEALGYDQLKVNLLLFFSVAHTTPTLLLNFSSIDLITLNYFIRSSLDVLLIEARPYDIN